MQPSCHPPCPLVASPPTSTSSRNSADGVRIDVQYGAALVMLARQCVLRVHACFAVAASLYEHRWALLGAHRALEMGGPLLVNDWEGAQKHWGSGAEWCVCECVCSCRPLDFCWSLVIIVCKKPILQPTLDS